MELVKLQDVSKTYRMDSVPVKALSSVNATITRNAFTVISGASGSGKSTLLNAIGCIDRPDSGEVYIEGKSVYALPDDSLSDFRARNIGFIFQNFNLIPVLTAYENVEYQLVIAKIPLRERKERVQHMLAAVGLEDKAGNRPGQLSGGQRQRVAIARALVSTPAIVLADEPTANLDSKTGSEILALMRKMQQEQRTTFIVSSHDPKVLEQADEAIRISDGKILAGTN